MLSKEPNKAPNQFPEKTLVEPQQIRYDILVEENVAGIFYLKNDRIAYANAAFSKVLGMPSSVLTGSSILDQIEEADRQVLEEGLEKIIRGEAELFSEDLQLKQEGEEATFFSLHLKVHSRQEGMVEIIGASRNATARVKKNIEFRKTKSKFEALYRNIIDGIVIYDYNQEKMVDHNEAALRILGYDDSAELMAINRLQLIPKYSSYFPGADMHQVTQYHGERVRNGEAFHSPGLFNGKGDKQVIVNVNVVPTFAKPGEAFVIFHDITSKVLSQQAEQESEKKYRDIFENSHEAIIYRKVSSGCPIICNQNALDIFGVATLEELAALQAKDFFVDNVIEGKSPQVYYEQKMQEALEKGRTEVSFWMKKQTGAIIRVFGILIGDPSDAENSKVISFLRDVTHLHQIQQNLNEKNDELKKYIDSNLQLENFAYFASHDLQTPLRSMISFTQLLKRKLQGRLSEEEQEYMNFIISSSNNMRNLVNDLLSYSRVNTSEINIKTIALKHLLTRLCAELKSSNPDRELQIHFNNIPEYIQADKTKIRQVFQNIISNGLKFSKKGVTPIVEINCREDQQSWMFSIKDNGIGIAPEFQHKIFLLFKRLHGNTEYEGTGIGLAMVKKIIEQHKGEIGLDSELGGGSNFWFTIKKQEALEE